MPHILTLFATLNISCSGPAAKSEPQNEVAPTQSVEAFHDNIHLTASRHKGSGSWDIDLLIKDSVSGKPIDLSKAAPSVQWSGNKQSEKSAVDASQVGVLHFQLTRGSYCWDGEFTLSLKRETSKRVKVPFSISPLCEKGR